LGNCSGVAASKNNKSKPKKKNGALAAAASRKLAGIGGQGKYTPEDVAHAMMHAEEDGQAQRVDLDDGTWGWRIQGPGGETKILKPTPEILAALARFEREGHPGHD
jgi:hypothetical protein